VEDFVYVEGKKLRRGYTTGSAAAGAAKAAALMATSKQRVDQVRIDTPKGTQLTLNISNQRFGDGWGIASVPKDAGDDADVTDGLDVFAEVTLQPEPGIVIEGGEGVGRVTKPGLDLEIGSAAINAVPRAMIVAEVEKVIDAATTGARVVISVPGGEEVAKKTFNPRLGIVGGISILGTTGIVEPMSTSGWKESVVVELKMKRRQGLEGVILVPGNQGERCFLSAYRQTYGVDQGDLVQIGNFVGDMLKQVQILGYRRVVLAGHLSKLVKVAGGIFNTHSKVADARMEILVARLALMEAPGDLLRQMFQANTTEEAMDYISASGFDGVYRVIADAAEGRVRQYLSDEIDVGVALFSRDCVLVGESRGLKPCLEGFCQ